MTHLSFCWNTCPLSSIERVPRRSSNETRSPSVSVNEIESVASVCCSANDIESAAAEFFSLASVAPISLSQLCRPSVVVVTALSGLSSDFAAVFLLRGGNRVSRCLLKCPRRFRPKVQNERGRPLHTAQSTSRPPRPSMLGSASRLNQSSPPEARKKSKSPASHGRILR